MKRSILSALVVLLTAPIVACTATVGGGPGPDGSGGGSVVTGNSGGTTGQGAGGHGGQSVNPGAGGNGSPGAGGNGSPGAGGNGLPGAGGSTSSGLGGNGQTGAGGSANGTGGDSGAGGAGPFQPAGSFGAVRKVKNLLVGLAPTDADVATVTTSGVAGLQSLIATWTSDASYVPFFKDKMVSFYRNLFQQVGFSPTDDFKPQLLENGGFDFGPLGTAAVGDDAFARLVQNLQDSFALTAWQTVVEKRPFTDTLTTTRFMMTTALKSLYIQIEMPDDEPYAFGVTGTKLAWSVDMSGNAIALTDTLNPQSPNYMIFDDEAPVKAAGFTLSPSCHGTTAVDPFGSAMSTDPSSTTVTGPTGGYAQLFQRLIGYTPRWPFLGNPVCWEHASKPYFTTTDLTDWQWVTVRAQNAGESYVQPYDLPTLRTTTTLALKLPRIGFYTTPAFLALWNTNDSNQHRVTANQTLLVALGQSFTSANSITPLSAAGLDSSHAVAGTECYGCHKSLDPLRQFWATQLDFNDRNDFPARGNFMGGAANPRPSTTGGALAFGNVNATGANMTALGPLLEQVQDQTDPSNPIDRFAMSVVQKLCYYANSAGCLESDPEFRRIALGFMTNGYDFMALTKDFFSSPLVTAAADTQTADQNGTTISVARRTQICAALSNRLGIADICAQAVPLPSTAQAATLKIVSSVAADAFSRGSEIPVTPPDPTLFYRAASEMLCENVAPQVVDVSSGTSVYSSSSTANVTTAIDSMVQKIIGYPPSDPHYAMAIQILTSHYSSAVSAQTTGTAATKNTNALRSTFSLACQSPTFLSFGI
jgi:hypothetical protein